MLLHMRDGEVVLYRRANSPVWQSRYKLQDGSWCRASIPYQTFAASLLHKFVSGHFVSQR